MRNFGKGCIARHALFAVACAALVVPAFGQAPAIFTGGTVNAADYTRTFAPGGLVAIFGSHFAASPQQPTQFPLPTSLGGVSVLVTSNNGEQCPLWYVSAGQINAQLPYDVPVGQAQVQIRTAAGVSNTDVITVTAAAPKIFTQDFSGTGAGVVTNTAYKMLTAANPANPADTIVLWMNSLGAPTSGGATAGQPAPGVTPGTNPLTVSGVTATINGISSPVTFAGLSPGSSGLYQVNVQAPFAVLTGTVPVLVKLGGVTSQANVTLSYQQLGFYSSILGGKAVSGQSLNGISGSTSALAFRQSDQVTWGPIGYNAWTNNTGLGSAYSATPGLALTLFNGTNIVYDNNGIETNSAGSFYNNAGGGSNTLKPGLADFYSMSNYFPLIFSGYFKLAQATTITSIVGYFDTLGNYLLPFDPANPYVKYRMNIWSETAAILPRDTGNFTGDVFTSDTTAGTFSYSQTAVNIISSKAADAPKPINRLKYTLAAPLTLPAGEYWFSHDASVRATPGASSTAQAITLRDFSRMVSAGPDKPRTMLFSFFGRPMSFEESFTIPGAFTILPSAVIEHQ